MKASNLSLSSHLDSKYGLSVFLSPYLSSQHEQNALQLIALESQIHTQAAEFDNQIYQMELQNIYATGDVIVHALADCSGSIIPDTSLSC